MLINSFKCGKNTVRFTPKMLNYYPLDIEYAGKFLTAVTNINFPGMQNDDHLY
jgi:hypothetical protein